MLMVLLTYLLQDSIDLFTVNMDTIYIIEGSTALPEFLTVLIGFFRAVKKICIEKIDQLVHLYIYRFSSGLDWAEPEPNLTITNHCRNKKYNSPRQSHNHKPCNAPLNAPL